MSPCDFCSTPPRWASPGSSISSDLPHRSGHPCCVERWIEVHAWGLAGAGGILAASFPPPSCSIHANGNESSPKLVGPWAAARVSVPRGPRCAPWAWRLGEQWQVWAEQQGGRARSSLTWAQGEASHSGRGYSLCCLRFFFIKIQVIYSVVAASGVWQSGSVTRMCSFLPPLPLSVTTGS